MARFIEKRLERLNLAKLFAIIKDSRVLDTSGDITFQGARFFETEAILSGVIDLNPEIRGSSRDGVKIRGIREACKDEELTKESLLNAVKDAEIEHLRKPKQRFVILGNISITQNIMLSSRHFREHGIRISFPPYRPPKFQEHPRVKIFLGSRPQNFGRYFRASVWARTPEGAATRALGQLDVLRALWNIALTRNQHRYFNYHRQPLNSIIVGPVYTAHTPRGVLVERQRYWFEPGYCYDARVFHGPFRRWQDAEVYERTARHKISKLPTAKYKDLGLPRN